jgi:hypothetical protein
MILNRPGFAVLKEAARRCRAHNRRVCFGVTHRSKKGKKQRTALGKPSSISISERIRRLRGCEHRHTIANFVGGYWSLAGVATAWEWDSEGGSIGRKHGVGWHGMASMQSQLSTTK